MTMSWILLLGMIAVAAVDGGRYRMSNSCRCPRSVREVCGSDGLTYKNFCFLDCASAANADLKMLYNGPCKTAYELCRCPLTWRPVCGSDGFTYGNMCELLCTANHVPYDLYMAETGTCPGRPVPAATESAPVTDNMNTVAPTEVTLGGDPILEEEPYDKEDDDPTSPCQSYEKCDRRRCRAEPAHPVCGSNGRTYRNVCQFCCDLNKSPVLTIASEGKCRRSKKPRRTKPRQKSRGRETQRKDQEMDLDEGEEE